jgi:hypothetical protein
MRNKRQQCSNRTGVLKSDLFRPWASTYMEYGLGLIFCKMGIVEVEYAKLCGCMEGSCSTCPFPGSIRSCGWTLARVTPLSPFSSHSSWWVLWRIHLPLSLLDLTPSRKSAQCHVLCSWPLKEGQQVLASCAYDWLQDGCVQCRLSSTVKPHKATSVSPFN